MENQGKRKPQDEDSEVFAFGALLLLIAIVTLLIIVKNI
jgi:hypothetical protein